MKNTVLIKNAIVVDGTGVNVYESDIAIENGKITKIGKKLKLEASIVIDCEERLFVAPGFIDTHSHNDFSVLYDQRQEFKVIQGVTVDIGGNCGLSLTPITEKNYLLLEASLKLASGNTTREEWLKFNNASVFFERIESYELGVNVGYFIGHGIIRSAVMGFDNRRPTEKELDEMKSLLRNAMENGAMGMSTGLIYPPGVFADTDELVELLKVVSEYDGVHASHMRNESYKLIEAIEEIINIAEKSDVKTLISHHKAVGMDNYGKSEDSLKLIDNAIKRGLNIRLDQYPYIACSTSLSQTIPPEYHEGGQTKLIERLKDKKIKGEIIDKIFSDDNSWDNLIREAGFENIMVIGCQNTPEANNKSIKQYSDFKKLTEIEALFEILIENNCEPGCVEFAMSELDVERILAYPFTMIGSDSGYPTAIGGHPRTTGTFPRVIGRYVREKNVISLVECIRKMTSMPADFLGIKNKGYIKEGYDADLTIFNFDTIIDKSDYYNPNEAPLGIEYVLLGGKVAVEKGRFIGNLAGKLIKKDITT